MSISDLVESAAEGECRSELSAQPLPPCGWSREVALDPRHRPQTLDRPASTVRRDWWRGPQEAHLLEESRGRYRQLTWQEIALLQGFQPSWFDIEGLSKTDRIRAIGDAVPPPLARALFDSIAQGRNWSNRTAIELCAGAGGLASGVRNRLEHVAIVDHWQVSCEILRHEKPWSSDVVHEAGATDMDWGEYADQVGLLSGGPPCQPWSQAGKRQGFRDPRDLLGGIHKIVATIKPEAFLFENVPGLASESNRDYFDAILDNLRRPGDGLRYGVMAAIFNAADYGVPQVRRRLFFVGFRDEPTAAAWRTLDAMASLRSHRAPTVADPRRRPWRTVGDTIGSREDPGGWRGWVENQPTPAPIAV